VSEVLDAGPIRVIERRPARGVLIPSYATLRIVTTSLGLRPTAGCCSSLR